MADISDVEQAIVDLIGGIVYPNGTAAQSSVKGKAGAPVDVRVYRGWPIPSNLDKDLAAKAVNISVHNRGSVERNTTRFSTDYRDVSRDTATITATVLDNTVTIAGSYSINATQFVTVLVGPRIAVSAPVGVNDTPATIAASLAALIVAQGIAATSSGAVLTVDSSAFLVASVGVNGIQMSEIRRQQSQVMITLWCPDPQTRDNAAKLIEPVLAATTFLTASDNSAVRFKSHGTTSTDASQKEQAYRRDLIYDVEYGTMLTDTATEITSVSINSQGGPAPIGTSPPNPTTNSVLPTA